MNELEKLVERELVGMRVRIIGDHPHANCSGEVISIDKTIFGYRPKVRLDFEHAGVKECFVMKPANITKESRAKPL